MLSVQYVFFLSSCEVYCNFPVQKPWQTAPSSMFSSRQPLAERGDKLDSTCSQQIAGGAIREAWPWRGQCRITRAEADGGKFTLGRTNSPGFPTEMFTARTPSTILASQVGLLTANSAISATSQLNTNPRPTTLYFMAQYFTEEVGWMDR